MDFRLARGRRAWYTWDNKKEHSPKGRKGAHRMRTEREKLNARIKAATLRLSSGGLELPPDEVCRIVLFSGGSCIVRQGDETLLASPGCVLLLGPGAWTMTQAGHTPPELLGCAFPPAALHEMKNITGEDQTKLFAPGSQLALYGSVQWASRLRTLLEMMRSAGEEQEYPGGMYLALVLHYVEQEYRAHTEDERPRNETVEQICAYLAANYQQKFSLTEVAARFYISPYYLSRLFRRVTGQSIVDYINARRIEAAQKLLETTELSISAVAEQTGFASAAHFRRVFREQMGVGPLQYRKSRR